MKMESRVNLLERYEPFWGSEKTPPSARPQMIASFASVQLFDWTMHPHLLPRPYCLREYHEIITFFTFFQQQKKHRYTHPSPSDTTQKCQRYNFKSNDTCQYRHISHISKKEFLRPHFFAARFLLLLTDNNALAKDMERPRPRRITILSKPYSLQISEAISQHM